MIEDTKPRDAAGRFAKLVCVNAHDRCYEGGPCPYCEPQTRADFADYQRDRAEDAAMVAEWEAGDA